MGYSHTNDILVINENLLEAKKLKVELKNKISGCVAASGIKALNMIKHYPDFSDIFIPLELADMASSDFIKFSKRYSPNANYILISPPALPDLGWLIVSKEIDGYIQEPLSVKKILNYLDSFKNRCTTDYGDTGFSSRRPSPYFTGTVFSKFEGF